MDVICINGTFQQEQLDFYKKHGVLTPIKDKLYTIRRKVWNRGKLGVYLEELVNPEIPIQSIISSSGVKFMEPNWNIDRFRTLQGDVITEEMLENITVDLEQ